MPKKRYDWIDEAKRVFSVERPTHFTNYEHCEECNEHDQTLINSTIDGIGLEELGNPGWDPICFCSPDGKKYFMPSFVRLSLETIDGDFYFSQLLFHLESDAPEYALALSCNNEQRRFIQSFIEYMILCHPEELTRNSCECDALRVHAVWSDA